MKLELIKITRDEKVEFALCVDSNKHFTVYFQDGRMLEFSEHSNVKNAQDFAKVRYYHVDESHEQLDIDENWNLFLEILDNCKSNYIKDKNQFKKEYKDLIAATSSKIDKINKIRRETSTERWKKIRNN